jgi:hypothetical protein
VVGDRRGGERLRRRADRHVASGALGDLSWIEQRNLAEGSQAFADLATGTVAAAKIVLRP